MTDLVALQVSLGPIQDLMVEEWGRVGVVPSCWGDQPPLVLGRRRGWVVLKKGFWDIPVPQVVVIGKAT